MSVTTLDFKAIWLKAEFKAKGDAALMYPPEPKELRERCEKELTAKYYLDMLRPPEVWR